MGRDEVDLLAFEPARADGPAAIVLVEVRSHTTSAFGPPEAGVDRGKVARLYRAAAALRRAGALPDGTPIPRGPWRVDLVVVDRSPRIGPGMGGEVIRHLRAVEPP